MQFKNFDEFRAAFWKEVAKDPSLASQFDPPSIQRMKNGFAPSLVQISNWADRKITFFIIKHQLIKEELFMMWITSISLRPNIIKKY